MAEITPKNLTAQLSYRAAGNPPAAGLETTISNCFPGLEVDFRNLWTRLFEGLQFQEATGTVLEATRPELSHLVGLDLIAVEIEKDGQPGASPCRER